MRTLSQSKLVSRTTALTAPYKSATQNITGLKLVSPPRNNVCPTTHTTSENWFQALNQLGIPTISDPNAGLSAGGYFLPDDIDPNNQTRSDARRRYYDPYAGRPNLNVLAQSQVTQILFEQSSTSPLHATGVAVCSFIPMASPETDVRQYASGPGAPVQTVIASQEVIVAAGAVHSPQLLQLSGIGPSGILESFGIPVLKDLPGVGSNLQDHPMIHLNYSCKSSQSCSTEWRLT